MCSFSGIPGHSTIYFPLDEAQVANIPLDLSFTLQDPAGWWMPSALQSLRFLWLWGWLPLTHVKSMHHPFSKSWLAASLMPSRIWNLSSSEVPVELWPSAAGRHPGEVMWCKELPFWMVWLIASIWSFTLLHPQLNSNQPGKESPWTYFTTCGKAVPKGMANHAFAKAWQTMPLQYHLIVLQWHAFPRQSQNAVQHSCTNPWLKKQFQDWYHSG